MPCRPTGLVEAAGFQHQLRTVNADRRSPDMLCGHRDTLIRRTSVILRFALPAVAIAAVAGAPADAAQRNSPDMLLEAQILLDRQHHSPGVIDGQQGGNTRRAIRAFELAEGLPADGQLDEEVLKRLRASSAEPLLADYTVSEEDVSKLVDVPEGMEAQASLEHLGFETAAEALAEKFHMSQTFLKQLNPGGDLRCR